MPSPCPACQRIADSRAGVNPFFIAELRESVAVLSDHQSYEGWTVLLLKDHAEHLHLLDVERQRRLAEDVAVVARAVAAAFSPNRINYECLGNQLAHIHWHVIPRYLPPVDPEPRQPIWGRDPAQLNCGVTPEKRSELINRLRDALMR